MRISIIVAIAENRAIGFENHLLYRLPNDLKRFKALTSGHTVVMGRRTFESLPKGALPNRRNIVLSTTQTSFPGADTFPTLEAALKDCHMRAALHDVQAQDVYVIGGASVYERALPFADRICLTYVYDTPTEADTFFPEIDMTQWKEVWREEHEADERHAQRYAFVDYERDHE
jgi:dihydrofolate reductase